MTFNSSLTSFGSDTLVIPALLSASSAFLILVHLISTHKRAEYEEEHEPSGEETVRGFVIRLRNHAACFGGLTIFVWRILRLLAIISLVGLAVATLVSTKSVAYGSAYGTRFLNWTILGTYVRALFFVDC